MSAWHLLGDCPCCDCHERRKAAKLTVKELYLHEKLPRIEVQRIVDVMQSQLDENPDPEEPPPYEPPKLPNYQLAAELPAKENSAKPSKACKRMTRMKKQLLRQAQQ